MNNISFIGGGRMAEAMIQGIIKADLLEGSQILVADPVADRRATLQQEFGVQTCADSVDVWANELIVLAVKPQIVETVLQQCRGKAGAQHVVISIAAGVPISTLESLLGDSECRVIRVMPNTPALVQQGAAALSPGSKASQADLELAKTIFDAIGNSVILEERYLDAVTGLSGSGPAYVLSFIESLIDAGVKVGLDANTSRSLVLQTVLGTVTMAIETGEHPANLKSMVTSPGGTTIAGLHVMEKAGFKGIVMDAVEKATARSVELGSKN